MEQMSIISDGVTGFFGKMSNKGIIREWLQSIF